MKFMIEFLPRFHVISYPLESEVESEAANEICESNSDSNESEATNEICKSNSEYYFNSVKEIIDKLKICKSNIYMQMGRKKFYKKLNLLLKIEQVEKYIKFTDSDGISTYYSKLSDITKDKKISAYALACYRHRETI